MGQWAPLLTAAAVLPWLGFFLAAKPTIGGAIFLGYPDRRALWTGIAVRRWPYLLVLVYLPALAMALGVPPFRTSAPVPNRL